jgi:hypothetical protein
LPNNQPNSDAKTDEIAPVTKLILKNISGDLLICLCRRAITTGWRRDAPEKYF